MEIEEFENLREQLNRIEEEIGDLRETRRKTIESIDTFNGKNSQGKIIKLEIETVLQKERSKGYCFEMYHPINNLKSKLVEDIKNYFQDYLKEVENELSELEKEKKELIESF